METIWNREKKELNERKKMFAEVRPLPPSSLSLFLSQENPRALKPIRRQSRTLSFLPLLFFSFSLDARRKFKIPSVSFSLSIYCIAEEKLDLSAMKTIFIFRCRHDFSFLLSYLSRWSNI